jgi:hypothetical protein
VPTQDGGRLNKPRSMVVPFALAASGILVRLVLSWVSIGTNDADTWSVFAWVVDNEGLRRLYEKAFYFNHPPLMGLLALLARRLSLRTGLQFAFTLRLFPIAADVCTAVVIALVWKVRSPRIAPWAAVAVAWNPVLILISGYHGNTDCICVLFSVLACYFLEQERPFLSGLALAAGINVKLIALVLAAGLFFHHRLRGRSMVLRFAAGLAFAALPFVPLMLQIPSVIINNVFRYSATYEKWGLAQLFIKFGAVRAQPVFVAAGRYLIFGSVIAVSLWNRSRERLDAYAMGAVAYALFVILTNGFAVQYLAYPAALLLATSLGWGIAYGVVAGAYLTTVYAWFWAGYLPLKSNFRALPGLYGATFVPWGLLVAFVIHSLRAKAPSGAFAPRSRPRVP